MRKSIFIFFIFTSLNVFCQNKTLQKETKLNYNQLSSNSVYELYPTQNMWTFLKLNTRTGEIWQVQYDVKDNNRFETVLSSLVLVKIDDEQNGRFNLYPTQNNYNFILLDRIDGRTWQVQWSIEKENRGIVAISTNN